MKPLYSLVLVSVALSGCAIELDRDELTEAVHNGVDHAVTRFENRDFRPRPLIAAAAPIARWPSTTLATEIDDPSNEAITKGWPPRTLRTRPAMIDPCSAARSGDGLYCGRSLGADADSGLYLCRNGRTQRVTPCAHGCRVQPPGTPDACATPPGRGVEFYLPLACGRTVDVLQGHHGTFSHSGMNTWAYDFTVPRGTPVFAMESGTVTHVRSAERPGSACWNGGGRGCIEHSNYVSILHADGTRTVYLHLDAPEVQRGSTVTRGQRIGRSGNTGWSTRPHLHVQRQSNCGRWFCQSQPLSFRDAGMPRTDARVTSRNCP